MTMGCYTPMRAMHSTVSVLEGGPLWKQQMGDMAWGAPVTENGIVYAGSWDNKLYAIRANGSKAWISEAGGFFAAEPSVGNGIVYAQAWEGLFALGATDGSVLWQAKTDDGTEIIGRPSIGDSAVYVSTFGGVYAFSATAGQKIWKKQFPSYPADPTYSAGRVFVGTQHGGPNYLYALDAANGNQLWVSPFPIGQNGDAVSAVAADRGTTPENVFIVSQDGYIYAFARSDGWSAWKSKIADSGQWPVDPTWSDDPLEMPFDLRIAPSGWLLRTQIRRNVPKRG